MFKFGISNSLCMLIHYYLWVFGSVSLRVTKLCINIHVVANYGLSMRNDEMFIGLIAKRLMRSITQQNVLLKKYFFKTPVFC